MSTNAHDVRSGVIIACPISKCEVRHVPGVGVLMRLHYIESAEQLQTGERTILQTLLDPEQALEIAETLKKSVQALEIGEALKKSAQALDFGHELKKSLMALPAPCPEILAQAALCQ